MQNAISPLPRKANQWIEPQQLRGLLRSNLGLNSRQATVKTGSSSRYLTIIIRDPAVPIAAVEAFAAQLHTWDMDVTDYVTGQSIHVEVSAEVRDALAAPFLPVVDRLQIPADQESAPVLPGISLFRDGWRMHFQTDSGERSRAFYTDDAPHPDIRRAMGFSLALLSA